MLSTPPAFILSQDQTLKKCVHNQKCTKRLEAQNQACLILWLQTISYRADARQRTGFSLWAALRQIMSSVQVQHKLTSLYIPFYCFKGSFDRSLNVPVSPGCLVQRIFEDCICVSLFSYQGSHLFTVVRDSLFTISLSKPFVNNFFSTFYFFKLFLLWFCGFLRQLIQNTTLFLQCQPENLTFFKNLTFSKFIQVFQLIFHFTLWQRIYYTFYILCHVQPLL